MDKANSYRPYPAGFLGRLVRLRSIALQCLLGPQVRHLEAGMAKEHEQTIKRSGGKMSFVKRVVLFVVFPLLRFEDRLREMIGYESKPKHPGDQTP